MAYHLAQRAETDLADIAYYIARESGSMEVARRVIELITERFHLLTANPHLKDGKCIHGKGRKAISASR